jgi:hypothetical protein
MGGLVNGVPTSSSQARVEGLNLIINGNQIAAEVLVANSQCTCSAATPTCSGETILTNLRINGVVVDARPAPNTRLAQIVATATVGTVTTTTTTDIILNEQNRETVAGTERITVNALRVTTTSAVTVAGITTTTTTEIIIAQAISDINCTAQPAPPTAATAMITGRADRLGYYQFNDLPTGDTYVITVRGKGYTFTPQTINLAEDSPLDLFGSAVGRSGT